jgi:anthranilate synthase component 2
LLETFLESKPILGICLGHQAIGAYFGAEIENLAQVIHGQPRRLNIADPYHYLFQGIDDKTLVSPYHSWIIGNKGFPDYLKIFALSEEGFIMAISHRIYDVCGIQFHPESIMTASGQRIINNWIDHS